MENTTIAASQALCLPELIDYVDGAIVSKEIIKKQSGTVTLFAFSAGQGLSEHSAPFEVLVQVLEGTGTLIIGGQEIEAGSGQTVLMPANVPHSVRADMKFKALLVMLKK